MGQGMYCVSIGGKFGWHTMRILDYFVEQTCGPEVHDKLNRLEESWDQQCVVDAYTIFQKWIDNGWVVPDFLTVSPDDSRFPFFSGDAGLVLEGVWAILADRFRSVLALKGRLTNRITGALLVCAGAGLALARRS